MKIFRGRKTKDVYIVELNNEGNMTILSLAKSLQVIDHSSEGFEWGHSGRGPAQLSAAILYEVTSNADMARQYYQLFLSDYVKDWGCTFEINEFQVNKWLQSVGANIVDKVEIIDRVEIVDRAKTQFERFHQFYKRAEQADTTEETQQKIEVIELCASAILLSRDWIQENKSYILKLEPGEYGITSEGSKWMPMLEGIRDQLSFIIDLLYDSQTDHSLLEVAQEVKSEIMELLAGHIYFSIM